MAREGEDEIGGYKCLAFLERALREIGVYTAYYAQLSEVVHVEAEAEIARPCKCAGEHLTVVFAGRFA